MLVQIVKMRGYQGTHWSRPWYKRTCKKRHQIWGNTNVSDSVPRNPVKRILTTFRVVSNDSRGTPVSEKPKTKSKKLAFIYLSISRAKCPYNSERRPGPEAVSGKLRFGISRCRIASQCSIGVLWEKFCVVNTLFPYRILRDVLFTAHKNDTI